MSRRLTHTPPAPSYGTYTGQVNNAYTSGDSSYIPSTNNYSSYHHNHFAPVPSGSVGAQHWEYDNPTHTGSHRGVYNPPSATQTPVQPNPPSSTHYHAPHQIIPALEARASTSTPYYPYDPSFEKYSNYSYTSTVAQSAEYSSGSLPRVNPGHPGHGMSSTNAAILQPSPHPAAYPIPYVDPHARPSKPVSSASPQEGSSRHATSSRTRAPVPSPQLLPREWYQSSAQPHSSSSYYSSQPTAQDLGPSVKVHDKEKHKPRKSSRSSRLDGIPKDQMQRFRVADMGPGPSSSGTKRTRSPGSDALPDAKTRATSRNEAFGSSKGKGKAGPSLEGKEADAKRKKEADRVQAYRDQLDDVYAELRALLYPDEENSKLAPSNHGKLKCIRDAVDRLKNGAPEYVWKQEEARLHAIIGSLNAEISRYQTVQLRLIAENTGYRQQVNALQETVDHLQRCFGVTGNSQA